MSTPATPPPPDANGTAPKPQKPPLPPLELTQAEMAVIKQWTGVYEKTLSSKDRLEMLANKILPRLTPLNTHLTKDAWRVRKSQVKRWFQNTFRRPSALARLSMTRKASLKQVACHVYKQEIAAIASRKANSAKPGSQQYMPIFQAAVNEFMETLDDEALVALEQERANRIIEGQPVDVKRKTVERLGHTYLEKSAHMQYNEMGRRLLFWDFHENRAGVRLFSFFDFNEDIGPVKVLPFIKKFPQAVEHFKDYWYQYMQYCYQVESGEEAPAGQARSAYRLMDLDRDLKGFPMLPPVGEKESLTDMKAMIRSFVTAHYRFASGRQHDRVPWKQIKEHTGDFIDDEYLPSQPIIDATVAPIEDPSDMKKEQVYRLVEHWRRPVPACDLFRFSHVLVNSKADATTPALYKDSLGPHTVARQTAPIAANAEAGPSTIRPPTMASTLGWDEEYRADNPLSFTPGPDDINMHDQDMNVQDPQEPIIDPDLIGLTSTGHRQSEPAAPTVPRKNAKKPTKGKKPAKAKSKPAPQKGKKNTNVVPEDIEDDIEPPEPTTTITRPRPRPVPKNPHLMGNHTDMAQPDQSAPSGELPSAPVPSTWTFPPIPATLQSTWTFPPMPVFTTQAPPIPSLPPIPPTPESTRQAPPTPSVPPIEDIPTPSNPTTAPPVQATPTDSTPLPGPSNATEAPMDLTPIPGQLSLTETLSTETPMDVDPLPGQLRLTESAESGRPKRQAPKRKLDACLALQFEVAEKDAEKKRLQLEAARRKRQRKK
ncbi:hypothetical protein B0H34DRAFT_794366 [Crassisporium funariophilum]|nr:hypothetical protein B0H34DRAFT_794366 [Crassisporium funariophilum]